jgi:hypothetical protein
MPAVVASVVASFLFAFMLPPAAPAGANVSDLNWLSGSWKLESRGRVIEEHWTTPAGGTMIGMSRTVANGKTVEFEFLRIEQRDDDIFYIAQPQGRPPTEFKLISNAGDDWVFANPQHDFPRNIRYKRNDETSITARIEDESGSKHMDFPYSRMK